MSQLPRTINPNFQEPTALKADTAGESSVLRIESTTWNRDSHELFDYESRHVFARKYLMRRCSARLFRSQLDVSIVSEGGEFPTSNSDYLLSVKARDGKFLVYPAERPSVPSNVQARKLWLVIKHLQRSSFPLAEGDVIKLGRFKLRVKQVVADAASTTEVDFKLDDTDAPATDLTPEEAATMQCRICLLEGGEPDDPLVRACQCKGSIMYVHLECLRHWVNSRLNLSADDPARACCFVKQIQCELCKSTFPSFVTARGDKLAIVRVPNVQPPFIVLENMVGPTNRGVHLCSMSVKKECKLGRGHESDVRIADVSISRFHAVIKHLDGVFYLEDHGSKFGTLVALRKPTMVERTERLSVQVGRTVLKFSLEDAVNFPSDGDLVDISDPAPAQDADQTSNPGASPVAGASPSNLAVDPIIGRLLQRGSDGAVQRHSYGQDAAGLRMSPFGVHLNQLIFNGTGPSFHPNNDMPPPQTVLAPGHSAGHSAGQSGGQSPTRYDPGEDLRARSNMPPPPAPAEHSASSRQTPDDNAAYLTPRE